MAAVNNLSESLFRPSLLTRTLSPYLASRIRFSSATPTRCCALLPSTRDTRPPISGGNGALDGRRARAGARLQDSVQLKEDWLDSLSCPFPQTSGPPPGDARVNPRGSDWVIGIDPDSSGALALLKPESSGFSAQVFDTPYLQVLVGKKIRKRLDARSIVQLLHNLGAPLGTTAYIEQSIPFPKDGKQGWWSGGFTYGLWIGVLVASGFSVVPVSPRLWKDQFELSGSSLTKDDSRKAALIMFPYLSSYLKRKKDHGRAEALLIAAYGKGLMIQPAQAAV